MVIILNENEDYKQSTSQQIQRAIASDKNKTIQKAGFELAYRNNTQVL